MASVKPNEDFFRRRGTVYIHSDFYLNNVKETFLILNSLMPYRMEHLYGEHKFRIDGYSYAFDTIDEYTESPVYEAIFHKQPLHPTTLTFEKRT